MKYLAILVVAIIVLGGLSGCVQKDSSAKSVENSIPQEQTADEADTLNSITGEIIDENQDIEIGEMV